ncbi:hypothetical protein JM946_02215 [Steroidobacter sp. S1-65]|uniref:Uncharacterized protein n=1 Tax=Steroidobacter gossypii TaxID=2805490 RepID=A0ABS1WRD5_9GAMM|nr:hypothetical protein [Steroidobacter gossypii]MBM0103535.1 hypothetical protein [Steroidobacter gossypii]
MAVPWLQIVQLVPSIVEVSRELLKRTKRMPEPQDMPVPENVDQLAQRVLTLEDNERRQAELVNQMAQQMSNLTRALTALHRQVLWLGGTAVVAIVVAIVAIGMAATQ